MSLRGTVVVWCALGLLGSLACKPETPAAAPARTPTSEDEKTLYALGLLMARSVTPFNLNRAELEMVTKGLSDGVTGAKPDVELQTYGPKVNEMAQKRQNSKSETEKAAGKAFADKAAAEPGAEKLPGGSIYKEITPGTGAAPQPTDVVKVHYKGTLTDGTEFDSSYKRNEPTEFPLNAVIKCWTEGVGHMKVGGKAKLVCPSDVAYGDQGRPPTIPGGATLVFEVELLGIQGK